MSLFVTGYARNRNFGFFWGPNMHFLQNIVRLLLSKQRKSYDKLNLKKQLKIDQLVKNAWVVLGYFLFKAFVEPAKGISKIVMIDILTVVIFKILNNLVFAQTSLFTNNCWPKQNFVNCPTRHCLYFEFDF